MSDKLETDRPFLSRWSQRKLANPPETQKPPTPEVEIPPPLEDADMPSVETLTGDSDYSGFLSPKVSNALRRQALRKLFHSESFNVLDGLNDYDEDFRNFEPLGDVVVHNMRKWLDEPKGVETADAETETAPESEIAAEASVESVAPNDPELDGV